MPTLSTPAGPFTVLTDGERVLAAGFTTELTDLLPQVHPELREQLTDEVPDAVAKAVTGYFEGDVSALDRVPVHQRGGEFRAHAWAVLRRVPAGEPISYRQFAALAGRPLAIRAAAAACAQNAVALFVPCHRVLRTDGSLGGYRWGLDVKRFLLAHEKTPS